MTVASVMQTGYDDMPFPRQRGEGFLYRSVKPVEAFPNGQHIFTYVEVKPFA